MIGKQIKGTSFRGVLNYLHAKEGSRLIGGNMAGKTPRTLAAEFRVARELNPQLKKAVYHASLSLAKTERVDEERWRALAADYIKGMGFSGSQYAVYRHADRDHDHIHIVASRIRLTDGSTVSDSWDYRRSEALIRSLEEQYQLEAVRSSRERESRAPTTGEQRRFVRTGEVGERVRLQTLLDHATQDCPSMPQLIHRLKDQGVDVRVSYTRNQKVRGISYSLDGVAFSGTHLGKAYTFPGLQKYRGVTYDHRRQYEETRTAAARVVEPSLVPGDFEDLIRVLGKVDRDSAEHRSRTETPATRADQLDPNQQQANRAVDAARSLPAAAQQFPADPVLLSDRKPQTEGIDRQTADSEALSSSRPQQQSDHLDAVTVPAPRATESSQRSSQQHRDSPGADRAAVGAVESKEDQDQRLRALAIYATAKHFYNEAVRAEAVEEISPGTWQLSGRRYSFTYSSNTETFTLSSQDERGELLRVKPDQSSKQLKLEMANHLTPQDVRAFEEIERWLQEREVERQRQQAQERQRQRGRGLEL